MSTLRTHPRNRVGAQVVRRRSTTQERKVVCGVSSRGDQARSFVRGTRRITERLSGYDPLVANSLQLDLVSRQTISALARECQGLLEDRAARFALSGLIGLDAYDAETDHPHDVPTALEVLNWINFVQDALEDLYRTEDPETAARPRQRVVARIPARTQAERAKGTAS